MLILAPDIEDIVQDIFDPAGGRDKGPSRRGRKKGGRRGSLDISTLIAQPIRGAVNPHNALRFSPARYVFPIWNVYEGVSFTFALVDAFNDTLYESLLGVFEYDPNNCQELIMMSRTNPDPDIIGGPIGVVNTISCEQLNAQNGMTSFSGASSCPYASQIGFAALMYNQDNTAKSGHLAIGNGDQVPVAMTPEIILQPGESEFASISYEWDDAAVSTWGWVPTSGGFITALDGEVLQFVPPFQQ